MADEISISQKFKVTNGEFKITGADRRFNDDQTTIGSHAGVVDVGTSEEDMAVGDVTSEGWLEITNLDDTNYVTYGPNSAGSMVAFGRLEPGHTHTLKLSPGITLRWLANTASVKVQMLLLER